ncbi:hypothetical protein DFQ26_006459 [Actinomortierella ambigua]|nr:hypothetical protein DFQ26_006459 [Actinomortierella ambigua]
MAKVNVVVSVPSIAIRITDLVGRRGLKNLVLVSRLFNAIFMPRLWEVVDLKQLGLIPCSPDRLKRVRLSLRDALERHGHLIRDLVLGDPSFLFVCSDNIANLRNLVVADLLPRHWPPLLLLVKNQVALEGLLLPVENMHAKITDGFFSHLNPKTLRTLEIIYGGPDFYGPMVTKIFAHLGASSALEEICVTPDFSHRHYSKESPPLPRDGTFVVPKKLKRVRLPEGPWVRNTSYLRALITSIMQQCPSLELMEFPYLEKVQAQAVATAIQRHQSWQSKSAKSMSHLVFGMLTDVVDCPSTPKLIRACATNSIKAIKFQTECGGRDTIDAILKHKSSIEFLDMQSSRTASQWMHDILATCSKLHVFKAGGISLHHRNVFLGVDALRSPWLSQRLTKLQLPLTGFCDTQRRKDCRHHQRSCRIKERQLLAKIGQLHQLDFLDASYTQIPIDEADLTHPAALVRTHNSLEWSLDAGLDELAHLKKLEVFELRGVDHAIGQREKAWIRAHWPKLTFSNVLSRPVTMLTTPLH